MKNSNKKDLIELPHDSVFVEKTKPDIQLPTKMTVFNFDSSTITLKTKQNGIYVYKWIDYSSKYGLAFILSDNSVGLYFEDGT
jgi:hypothetical protein